MMSILSKEPDGVGYYYGFLPGDSRRIDVTRVAGKIETRGDVTPGPYWLALVEGERVDGDFTTKDEAEAAAIQFIRESQYGGE